MTTQTGDMILKRFDMNTIEPNATILLIGKRGSGKSTLIKDIMFNLRTKINYGIVMSRSEEANQHFASFIPRSSIYTDYSDGPIGRLMQYQKKNIKKGRHMFMILDDCMFDNKILKGTTIRELYLNGRHYQTLIINATQYIMDIPPAIRNNTDYVFLFKDNIHTNREKVWKHFFGIFSEYSDFNEVLDKATENFGCVVLNTRIQSCNPSDCVFFYHAKQNIQPFRVCDPCFWNLDSQFSRQQNEETDEKRLVVPKKIK